MGVIDKFLRVMFLGDGTQLKQTYNDLNKEGQKFSKEVEKHGINLQAVGKTMVAVGATIVGAFAATVVAVANTAGKINDLSNAAGVSAESFQELAYSAKQEGIEQETLAAGLSKLTKNMGEAKKGTGAAAEAFHEMKIGVTDTHKQLLPVDAILPQIADHFKGMTNPAEKANLAMALFGKTGTQFVAWLSQGSKGMKAYAEEARSMGIILSNETVKALDDFDDTLGNVKAGFGGLGNEIAADIVPALQTFANILKSGLQILNSIPAPIKQLGVQAVALSGGLLLVNGAIMLIISRVPAIIAGLTAMNASFAPFLVGNAIAVGLVAISGIFLKIRDNARLARLEIDKITELPEAKKAEAYWEGQVKGLERLKKVAEDAERANKAAAGSLGGGVVSMGFTPEQQARLDEALKKLTEAHNKVAELTKKEQENSQEVISQKEIQLEKEREIAKKREDFVSEWSQKEKNSAAERSTILSDEIQFKLKSLDTEKAEAIKKSHELGASTANIEKYYLNKKTQIIQEGAKQIGDFEDQSNRQLMEENLNTFNKIANDERNSFTKRRKAEQDAVRLRIALLENDKKQELKKAEELGASKQAILDKYAEKEKAIYIDIEEAHRQSYNQMAGEVVSYLDQLATGEITLKELIKKMAIDWMEVGEKKTIAEGIAGIAQAWADSGGIPYLAIPKTIPIIATTAEAVAGWEAGKAAVRGLEKGGLAVGPSFNLIGEGKYPEAVLPLSDEVLSKIGNSIVNATTNNSNSSSSINNSRSNVTNNFIMKGYDKSELKQLYRDMVPIINSENKRKGLK
jgi:hypothetical protein